MCPDLPNRTGLGESSHTIKWICPSNDTIIYFHIKTVAGNWVNLPDCFDTGNMSQTQLGRNNFGQLKIYLYNFDWMKNSYHDK